MQLVHLDDISEVITIHKKLQHLKSPQGTRDSPARSCLDLHLENPNIKDGETERYTQKQQREVSNFPLLHNVGHYWIDPNGGCINDAVEVFCNFSSSQVKTCISPSNKQADLKVWSGSSIWFSSLNGGFKVSLTNLSYLHSYTFLMCGIDDLWRAKEPAKLHPNWFTLCQADVHIQLPQIQSLTALPHSHQQRDHTHRRHLRWMSGELNFYRHKY